MPKGHLFLPLEISLNFFEKIVSKMSVYYYSTVHDNFWDQNSLHSKYREHYLPHRAMHDIPQFGSKVDLESYLAWVKKIEQLCPFIIRSSKYSIVDLCTSRFIEHASEW